LHLGDDGVHVGAARLLGGQLRVEGPVIDVNYFLRFAATILAGPECL
jgi:hypothetical protein